MINLLKAVTINHCTAIRNAITSNKRILLLIKEVLLVLPLDALPLIWALRLDGLDKVWDALMQNALMERSFLLKITNNIHAIHPIKLLILIISEILMEVQSHALTISFISAILEMLVLILALLKVFADKEHAHAIQDMQEMIAHKSSEVSLF